MYYIRVLSNVCLRIKGLNSSLIHSARKPPEEDPAVVAQDLPRPISEGEEVLARWSDDGWYYRGKESYIFTLTFAKVTHGIVTSIDYSIFCVSTVNDGKFRLGSISANSETVRWCRGVVVKHVDLQHRGCQFDSSMCHLKNAIGEEAIGSHLMTSTSLEKTQSPVSGFCSTRNRVCNAAEIGNKKRDIISRSLMDLTLHSTHAAKHGFIAFDWLHLRALNRSMIFL